MKLSLNLETVAAVSSKIGSEVNCSSYITAGYLSQSIVNLSTLGSRIFLTDSTFLGLKSCFVLAVFVSENEAAQPRELQVVPVTCTSAKFFTSYAV